MAHEKMTAHVETITPEYARSMLENQAHSRYLRHERISAFADAMKNGKWVISGDSIKILDNGQVFDGMHRLFACIQADVPFTTVVVRGIDPKIMETIDY